MSLTSKMANTALAPSNLSLSDIPFEILCHIFSYLSTVEGFKLAQTCRLMHYSFHYTPRSIFASKEQLSVHFLQILCRQLLCIRCLHVEVLDSSEDNSEAVNALFNPKPVELCECVCHSEAVRHVYLKCQSLDTVKHCNFRDRIRGLMLHEVEFGENAASALTGLDGLEELLIAFPRNFDAEEVLANIGTSLKQLRKIHLIGCVTFNDRCFQYLDQSHCPKLEIIFLRGAVATGRGLKGLHFPSLSFLGLSSCETADEDVQYIHPIPLCTLLLEETRVTSTGVRRMESSILSTSLRTLSLANLPSVEQTSLVTHDNEFIFPNLNTLDVIGTGVDREGLGQCLKMQLRDVRMSEKQVGQSLPAILQIIPNHCASLSEISIAGDETERALSSC